MKRKPRQLARKPFCLNGHPRTADNVDCHGRCVQCRRDSQRKTYAAKHVKRRFCPQCHHSVRLHDPDDNGRCYHSSKGAFDCECVLQRKEAA